MRFKTRVGGQESGMDSFADVEMVKHAMAEMTLKARGYDRIAMNKKPAQVAESRLVFPFA